MAKDPRDGFPETLYVMKGTEKLNDGSEENYYLAAREMDDWKPEFTDNTPVAIYELRTVGKMVTSRRFVLPPGEQL